MGSWRRPPKPLPPLQLVTLAFVVLANGQPVEGAGIILSVEQEHHTNEDGYAAFIVKTGTISYSVHKDGFESLGGTQDIASNMEIVIALTAIPAPVVLKRTGLVLADRRAMVDDGGAFLPNGASFFWAVWGMKFDQDRTLKNMDWLAARGFDFARIFCQVKGASWADRAIDPDWPDYEQILGETLDAFWARGLRTSPSIIADGGGVDRYRRALVDPKAVTGKVINVLQSRQEQVVYVTAANEDNMTPPEDANLKACVQMVRAAFPQMLVGARAAPMPTVDAYLDFVNFFSIHPDRTKPTERQIRQSWDTRDLRIPGTQDEPAGPWSSVATQDEPLHLAMQRAVGALCGLAAYVYHAGPGIRGGGSWDVNRGLPANFWDMPKGDEQVKAIRDITALLPADLPNWQKHNTSNVWPHHPLRPHAIYGENGATAGCNRSYAAVNGAEFITLPTGIVQYVDLVAQRTCQVKAYANGQLVKDELVEPGHAFHLDGPERAGHWAYLVKGTWL